jgi:hypothetical protein
VADSCGRFLLPYAGELSLLLGADGLPGVEI